MIRMRPCRLVNLLALVLVCCLAACASPVRALDHFRSQVGHGPRCAAIEVAATIQFSSDRQAALGGIAALTDLSEHEQLFLVEATIAGGGFSSDVTAVLVALARNPRLTDAARARLATLQHKASLFSSDRRLLANALRDNHAGT